ncbi:DNAJ HEAT SHOCK AMINO-TERMINAL DOMAIN PROTEIN [Salix viminalis]|uniref:DNAJ HEAT SHOCK AMINO-TERMINAL DOMAIN PROTEIN n=1 Tax=Salix viminalis TaxID=40686 RepID=A0A9Q0Z5H3_SALVM|nr:DNAJ HEAT SHOCK AMINO-TERMINAL DOMAIN PROTEIN [Salix viminalis]
MDCNKEEAFRAKGVAKSLMVKKDFPTARRILLRAQQLYRDLENISQMLTVCDVHCTAEKKLLGTDMDWYGILQIEETADEATIKKQYRKFALQLHPDKNQFPGAESAFKLIMDAQTVLLDKGKRSLHDIKHKASMRKPAPPYRTPQNATHSSNFTGFNPQHQQSQQAAFQRDSSNGRPTFWTACPFCTVKYQYYIEIINKPIVCQSCNRSFFAYERSGQGLPTASKLNQSSFMQRKNIPNQTSSKEELGRQGNMSTEPSKTEFRSEKVNGKRKKKQEEESSESCNTETDSDEDMASEEDGDFKAEVKFEYKGERPRRSGRQKQQVSYKENLSDDEDIVRDPKMAKWSGSFCATEEENGNKMREDVSDKEDQSSVAADVKDETVVKQEESNGIKETENVKGKEKLEATFCQKNSKTYIGLSSDSTSQSTSDPVSYDYPDPDFHDFDKDRGGECFSAGQVWAVYDTLDAMPRFYARIKKVISPRFNLRITWLEACPDDHNEVEWVEEGLPAACGKFKNGKSQYTDKQLMFSHLIDLEECDQRNTYKIFPRKGETWALFKNWDLEWKSNADAHQDYEYEFVEILSEYAEGVSARVTFLGKVKGFVSLFCRIRKEGMDGIEIPPAELFRFSHMIPSFKLTGKEREGVPRGSFELDPASLPKTFLETANPEDLGEEAGNSHCDGSCSRSSDKAKPEVVCESGTSMHQPDTKGTSLLSEDNCGSIMEDCSALDAIEIPEPEFFNFDAEKSTEKFQVGQIWSLYSDEDGLPKYYGQIMKIQSDQGFKLWLRWLTPCLLPKTVIQWQDKKMPTCCGRFKAKTGKLKCYSSTSSFSHRLAVEFDGKRNEYTILPRKGEIWALYKNWSPKIKHSDLENCEYDVVEVLDQNDLQIKVSLLERVSGFNSVFKTKLTGADGSYTGASLYRADQILPSNSYLSTDRREGWKSQRLLGT